MVHQSVITKLCALCKWWLPAFTTKLWRTTEAIKWPKDMCVKCTTLWRPAAFGDLRNKKRLKVRGFAWEYLRSCSGYGPSRSVKRRAKSSSLQSKKKCFAWGCGFFVSDSCWGFGFKSCHVSYWVHCKSISHPHQISLCPLLGSLHIGGAFFHAFKLSDKIGHLRGTPKTKMAQDPALPKSVPEF